MQVGLAVCAAPLVHREVVVDHDGDLAEATNKTNKSPAPLPISSVKSSVFYLFYVNPPAHDVGGDEYLLLSVPEPVEHPDALLHRELPREEGDGVAVRRHLLHQPGGRPPGLAEDHGLADGHHAVDVGDGGVLELGRLALHPVLPDRVKGLLLAAEADDLERKGRWK